MVLSFRSPMVLRAVSMATPNGGAKVRLGAANTVARVDRTGTGTTRGARFVRQGATHDAPPVQGTNSEHAMTPAVDRASAKPKRLDTYDNTQVGARLKVCRGCRRKFYFTRHGRIKCADCRAKGSK